MKNKKGFTLVELLAVIVVLSIVMLVVADRVGDAMLKSRGNSLALQVKSLSREIEKVGALENQISTEKINSIITSGDLTYLGYIKAGTGNFKNDAIVLQAKKGSKFSNIAFTHDVEELKSLVYNTEGTSLTLGNSTLKNSKSWLREPIIYIETTVPIYEEKPISNSNKFETIKPAPNIPSPSQKPAKIYKVGDEIVIGTEKFNVIRDNGNTVTMFAKKNITTDTHLQSDNAQYINFSECIMGSMGCKEGGYWLDSGNNLLEKYKTTLPSDVTDVKKDANGYPAYVFDSNSILYTHVKLYEEFIKNNFKKSSVTARVITYNELIELGCEGPPSYSCMKTENRKWLKNGQRYWTGTAGDYNRIWFMEYYSQSDLDGKMSSIKDCGIRPVLTIDKNEL